MAQPRILFLCGGAQPGADGVGDYTVGLAREVASLGFTTGVCALADPRTSEVHWTGDWTQTTCPTLRLPLGLSWRQRARALRRWLGDAPPETISLQFVPYAYHPRGIPWRFGQWLEDTLGKENRWQVFFHETWIGMTPHCRLKDWVIGRMQRAVVRHLLTRLDPVSIQTSNGFYVRMLQAAGFPATRLPLFSAIDRVDSTQTPVRDELEALGISFEQRSAWRLIGLFGSCYPDYPLEAQVREVAAAAQRDQKRLAFLGMGGGVGTGETWEGRVKAVCPEALVRHFGRRSDRDVSGFLSSLDLGLVATPWELLGKSSAAAAMAEHGVPFHTPYRGRFGRSETTDPIEGLFQSRRQAAEAFLKGLEGKKRVKGGKKSEG